MNEILAVGSLLTAFGLSGASGLNAYLPLLVTGILTKTDYIHLDDRYKVLGSWPAIAVIAALFLIDFVGDKVPTVDHIFHIAGTVIHPIAGALAFASQTGTVTKMNPVLSLLIGGVTGGGLHLARAAVRPLSTIGTVGIGNPILSTAEDATSGLVTALAFIIPILVVVVLAAVIWFLWRILRRAGRSLGPSPATRA